MYMHLRKIVDAKELLMKVGRGMRKYSSRGVILTRSRIRLIWKTKEIFPSII